MLISEQCKLDRINFREPQDDAKTYKQKETIRARFEGHDIHGETDLTRVAQRSDKRGVCRRRNRSNK
eukprot:TRINITY_DN1137_c0_g1_i2.p3 TRINITY_DN1137_c0_g1~~TRINITY_DN1137_c0_g1_i2.p3  ORF type:complete len:67 (+),score=0.23 TRINITY_DN1137_c0_g1_i2:74-274(+)